MQVSSQRKPRKTDLHYWQEVIKYKSYFVLYKTVVCHHNIMELMYTQVVK